MIFTGISRTFSTVNAEQYDTIGAFWDEMAPIHGRENLRGLGYNWGKDSIEYVIGLEEGDIDGSDCRIVLPDSGWVTVKGRTDDLDKIYSEIYRDGALTYELETFSDDGSCCISYSRD